MFIASGRSSFGTFTASGPRYIIDGLESVAGLFAHIEHRNISYQLNWIRFLRPRSRCWILGSLRSTRDFAFFHFPSSRLRALAEVAFRVETRSHSRRGEERTGGPTSIELKIDIGLALELELNKTSDRLRIILDFYPGAVYLTPYPDLISIEPNSIPAGF